VQPLRLHGYKELKRELRSFESLTAYGLDKIGHSIRLNDGSWIQREGLSVLPSFLEQNRIRIDVGRGFAAEDFAANSAPVLILSQMWEDLGQNPTSLASSRNRRRGWARGMSMARPLANLVPSPVFRWFV